MCMCYVCAQLHNFFYEAWPQTKKNYWNKSKNHFNEMKGVVGMSLHEKEGNKKKGVVGMLLHEKKEEPTQSR